MVSQLDAMKWKRRGLLFTTRGDTPISGFSKLKKQLDAKMIVTLQAVLDAKADDKEPDQAVIEPWRLHDIRRTGTTRMQALEIPIEVTEKVINHLSGETAGIRGVYNLYAYLDEKRAALRAWSEYLEALVVEHHARVEAKKQVAA